LRWVLGNFFPRISSNHSFPGLSIPSSKGYKCETQVPCCFCFCFFLFAETCFMPNIWSVPCGYEKRMCIVQLLDDIFISLLDPFGLIIAQSNVSLLFSFSLVWISLH
jgi:hypothetical protein